MSESIKSWIYTIIVFILVMSFLQQLIAGKKYEKYVRFYVGIILILVVISPFMALFSGKDLFEFSILEESFKQTVREAEMEAEQFHELQEEEVSKQYESQIQTALEQLLQEDGYELIYGDIVLEENMECENYMYPVQIQAQVKTKQPVAASDTDILVEIEEVEPVEEVCIEGTLAVPSSNTGVVKEADLEKINQLKSRIAEFFGMEKEAVLIEMG